MTLSMSGRKDRIKNMVNRWKTDLMLIARRLLFAVLAQIFASGCISSWSGSFDERDDRSHKGGQCVFDQSRVIGAR